jgi:DNA-binding MarR family transcriptional regulator
MPQATTPVDTATATRRRPADVTAERILSALSTVAQSTSNARLHERLLDAAGVRVDRAGAALLTKLKAAGAPLRVTALADRLGVDTPTVTRKVQQLERLGLVAREPEPEDRRAFRIGLTDDGRATLELLTAAKRRWLDELLDGWSMSDRATFSTLLAAFADRLHAMQEVGRG